jgi:ankyrin repeat protein
MKKIIVLCFSLCSGIFSPLLMAETIDIFAAARAGDTIAIKSYVTKKGDVNIKNVKSYTPFILAAYYAQMPALETLLEAGADPCAVDNKGSNAFMGVAFKGHQQIAKWLLENTQCDVNHQNYAGQTSLMMASLFGREDMIKLLLEQGADRHLKDKQGNTSVKLAQTQGLSRVVEIIQFHFQ